MLQDELMRSTQVLGKYLINRGHDATCVIELNKKGIKNGEVAMEANKDGAIILTCDEDFLKGSATKPANS
jgi:predicted nuclease of predicted toxin-antitoxin system